MSTTNTGFIGLGNMGKPMAMNLVGGAFQAWMYDVSESALAELVTAGAHAATPAGIARNCEVIGVCVRDDKDVEALLYGSEGLLQNAQPGAIIAIHSTVTQSGLMRWAADAGAHGVHVIDAPVTRGSGGAEPRFLCYMVGGDAALLERCRPVFDTSAEKIIHAGALGTGIALKLCNNLITYLEFIAMSEATALAERCGLSADVLREVGKANGVINDRMHQFISNRNQLSRQLDAETFARAFGSFGALGRKDLEAALQSARSLELTLPATELAHAMIEDIFLNRA